jgi:predicted phage-related endonuclease
MENDQQRTEQWRLDRAGKISASRMKDLLATNKKTGEPLKARQDYIIELLCERITGVPLEGPSAKALAYGTEVEPHGIAAYEAETGLLVTKVGFKTHPEFPYVGASADALVGEDGGLELKCPMNSCVHLETLETGIPPEHLPQVHTNIWVHDRQWWDFVSFDPRFPPNDRLYIKRVMRDADLIAKMAAACALANAEIEDRLAKHRARLVAEAAV